MNEQQQELDAYIFRQSKHLARQSLALARKRPDMSEEEKVDQLAAHMRDLVYFALTQNKKILEEEIALSLDDDLPIIE